MKSRAFAIAFCISSAVVVVAAKQAPPSRLSGVVVSAEDGKSPIRRAMVTIEGPSQLSQITDDEGKFVFDEVIAGEYQVTATRAAYLPAGYGARRPFAAGGRGA